jgi:DNA-binding transcriptional regulator YiaG
MIDPSILKIYSRIEEGDSALKVIRESLDMSQQEFASYIGVSTTSVSRWERGTSQMTLSLDQIRRFTELLRKLGMTLDNLPDNVGPSK